MVANLRQIEFAAIDGVSNTLTIATAEKSDQAESELLILCLPAMGVAASKYQALLHAFAARGHTAASFDLRGNGFSSVRASRACDFGYKELVEYDLPAALERIQQLYLDKRVVLFGHSLGGQVSVLHLTQDSDNIAGLVLAASCSVYYRGWPAPKSWGLFVFAQVAWLVAAIVGYFPGRKLGFGGREARSIMRDWAYNARTGEYALRNSDIDYRPSSERAEQLEALPVLAINFANDDFAPETATNYLLAKLGSKAVMREVVNGEQLGLASADHFNWLKKPSEVVNLCEPWLKTEI